MRSGEFRRMLDESVETPADQKTDTPETKPNITPNVDVKDDEMNEWLRYFGVEESDSG
jgi:hypothetical protein